MPKKISKQSRSSSSPTKSVLFHWKEDSKMDNKILFEAAQMGNTGVLRRLIHENPYVLTNFELTSPSATSLLNVAIKAGQLEFVRELMKQRPAMSREVDKDGLRAMDIASMLGNVEIVRELLIRRTGGGVDICHLKGKEGRTALHYAAIKGRVEVIEELLSACPESIQDVTIRGETALHLAVENSRTDVFVVLVRWLEMMNMEAVLNLGDCDGNTVLHLAASRKQQGCIELIASKSSYIGGIVEVNAQNFKGLTAMDILDIVIENPNDSKLKEIIWHSGGALRPHEVHPLPSLQSLSASQRTRTDNNRDEDGDGQRETMEDWFEYFQFKKDRDSPSDVRNALLVVAALIATVTFQAGVNPPTGILDTNVLARSTSGHAFASHVKMYTFVFANTLALSASSSIIEYLTAGFPFQRELRLSISFMMFTYGFSLSHNSEGVALIPFMIACVLPYLVRMLPRWTKKFFGWW